MTVQKVKSGDQTGFLALFRLILIRFCHTFFCWIRNFKGYNFVIDKIATKTLLHGVIRCRSSAKLQQGPYRDLGLVRLKLLRFGHSFFSWIRH